MSGVLVRELSGKTTASVLLAKRTPGIRLVVRTKYVAQNQLGSAWVPLRKFRSRSGRFPYQPHFVRNSSVVNGRKTALVVNSEFLRLGVLSAKPRPVRFEVPGSTAANPKPRNVGYSSKTGAQQVLRRFRETRLRCGFSRCGCYRRNRNVKDQRSSTACEW